MQEEALGQGESFGRSRHDRGEGGGVRRIRAQDSRERTKGRRRRGRTRSLSTGHSLSCSPARRAYQ
eukprot:3547768-Rhodomonas_salina.3